jgi:hypothetical protein
MTNVENHQSCAIESNHWRGYGALFAPPMELGTSVKALAQKVRHCAFYWRTNGAGQCFYAFRTLG